MSIFQAFRLLFSLKREEGQSLVEYALIIALVAIVLIVVVGVMTGKIQAVFQAIGDALAL